MTDYTRTLPLIAVLLLVSACSSLPPATSTDSDWLMQGRIGLWMGDQQESSQIRWLQCGRDNSRIRLSGPMGVGGAEIISDRYGAELNYKGETRRAQNAEQLAAEIGWPVPVYALRYWLRGQAAPDSPLTAKVSPDGRLAHLEQLGWTLDFAHDANAREETLPKRVEARRQDVRLKLLISSWSQASEECTK